MSDQEANSAQVNPDNMKDPLPKRSRSSEPPEPEGESQLSVDEEFRCAICLEVMVLPFTIIPCLHSFDKDCLVEWWKTNNNCPSCKKQSSSAKSAFQLKSIMDRIHQKKKRRTTSNPTDGDTNEIYPQNGGAPSQYYDIGDDDGDDTDDDDDATHFFPGENLVWPCIACPPNNVAGYTCSIAIPEPTDQEKFDESQRRGPNSTPVGPPGRGEVRTSLGSSTVAGRPGVAEHAQCFACTAYIPRNFPGPIKCGGCSKYFCNNLDSAGCPVGITTTSNFMSRAAVRLYNHSVHGLAGDHLPRTLRTNRHEVSRFVNYLNTQNVTVDDVLAKLFEMKHRQVAEDVNDREADANWGPNTWFCQLCIEGVVSNMLFDWWRAERQRSIDDGEDVVVVMPDCWYGLDCRTQTHNNSHAERYNHICPNARARN